jgi:hypothetical protein
MDCDFPQTHLLPLVFADSQPFFSPSPELEAYPSISCSTGSEYLRYQPLFVILLIGAVAFPLLVFARLYYLNRNGLLFNGEYRIVYGTNLLTRHHYSLFA